MKIVALVFGMFAVFSVTAQNSYLFVEPLPAESNAVVRVSEKYFGTYVLNNGTLEYTFDASGIHVTSTSISSISREMVRESSRYSVRNGYLFGVEKDDSILCIEKGDYYYFGVRNHDVLVGTGNQNVLTKTDDPAVFVLNAYEDGRYIPQLLEFKGNKLMISQFDYEGATDNEFAYIEEQEKLPFDNFTVILLDPEASDFERIRSQAFVENMVLKR